MNDEARLKEKLRAIEALFAGATTPGERGAARERILERIESLKSETPVEVDVTRLHRWNHRLFQALAKRYGLKTYRYEGSGQHEVTASTAGSASPSSVEGLRVERLALYAAKIRDDAEAALREANVKFRMNDEGTFVRRLRAPVAGESFADLAEEAAASLWEITKPAVEANRGKAL